MSDNEKRNKRTTLLEAVTMKFAHITSEYSHGYISLSNRNL